MQEKDYFEHLFNNEMWEIIVSDVTKGEVQAFVGMLILMGIVRLPRFQMYWESDQLIHQKSIANIMLRTRFFQIWRYFLLENRDLKIRGRGARTATGVDEED